MGGAGAGGRGEIVGGVNNDGKGLFKALGESSGFGGGTGQPLINRPDDGDISMGFLGRGGGVGAICCSLRGSMAGGLSSRWGGMVKESR